MSRTLSLWPDDMVRELQDTVEAQAKRISTLEKELLAEQVLHNAAKKLNFTFSEIIKEQDAVVVNLKAVAEVGCDMYRHYVPEDAMKETGWLNVFRAAGYLNEGE